MIRKISHTLMATLAACLLAFSPIGHANTIDETPSALAMTGDALFVRPALLATTIIGSAVYLVSLPFSLLGGNADEAGKVAAQHGAVQDDDRDAGAIRPSDGVAQDNDEMCVRHVARHPLRRALHVEVHGRGFAYDGLRATAEQRLVGLSVRHGHVAHHGLIRRPTEVQRMALVGEEV